MISKPLPAALPIALPVALTALVTNVRPLRRRVLTAPLLGLMKKLRLLPKMSPTERAALAAGDVWVESEFFSGRPNLRLLRSQPSASLTAEERAFLEGPVEELCRKVNDWQLWKERRIPDDVLEFLKTNRFFGMIIPKEYGGLGFSALAHSEVVMKLNSRSIPLAITVMVPNSLGPAELLIHYGTEEQKKHYLPRLADGREIPCFALTEPTAGSDAASIRSRGVVFRGEDGKLYLRLNWNKRWITLGAISTVLGLAFRLYDPERLLGGETDLGITCALIPSNTRGVTINQRHDPLGVPFTNSPTQGKDVVVPIEAIIGGPENAGQGWHMLMECLAAGRGISLPATAAGGSKLLTRVISAYAAVRKQFSLPIGKFEGVAEALARVAGHTYMIEASRRVTCDALNAGVRPPVITAIIKQQSTELKRKVVNDAMDIAGGLGISRGPRNLLAPEYIAAPIGITVEGANILTRTMIIIGQGAMRAHPYALREIQAAESGDLKEFDQAIWGHVSHVTRNLLRCGFVNLSRGGLIRAKAPRSTRAYWKKLSWASANFATLMDLHMVGLGGNLRVNEMTTGRLADFLSSLYLGFAVLKRFESEGEKAEDRPFLEWSMETCFHQIQVATEGLLVNAKIPAVGWILRHPVRLLARLNPIGRPPRDSLTKTLANLVQTPGDQRDERLTGGIYLPSESQEPLQALETAFRQSRATEEVFAKIRAAIKTGRIKKGRPEELLEEAHLSAIISQAERDLVGKAQDLIQSVIQVDAFPEKDYFPKAKPRPRAKRPSQPKAPRQTRRTKPTQAA